MLRAALTPVVCNDLLPDVHVCHVVREIVDRFSFLIQSTEVTFFVSTRFASAHCYATT